MDLFERRPDGFLSMTECKSAAKALFPEDDWDDELWGELCSSYGADPIAAEYGVKSPPAILMMRPGHDPISMPIPRKRDEFTEESLVEWINQVALHHNLK